MARQTITRWRATHIQKRPELKDVPLPASVDDVLELDEIWSFVLKKDHPRWLWAALCQGPQFLCKATNSCNGPLAIVVPKSGRSPRLNASATAAITFRYHAIFFFLFL